MSGCQAASLALSKTPIRSPHSSSGVALGNKDQLISDQPTCVLAPLHKHHLLRGVRSTNRTMEMEPYVALSHDVCEMRPSSMIHAMRLRTR